MRLGGPIFETIDTPDAWVQAIKKSGYRAASCPLEPEADDQTVRAYAEAARSADIVIAEVGAWSNPLSDDADTRQQAIEKCQRGLDLAERIGARCCVNIAGSRGAQWDGPHPDNLSEETFAMIVATTRHIIDAVQPKHAFYTLETMPWIFPDSPESYLRLMHAIDRPQFGAHLDPVNMINSPSRLFHNAYFLRECFRLLGPHIVCCHAKDIALRGKLTVHLDEVRPGQGALDYTTFLHELNALDADTPLILEHLPNAEEYRLAADYIRGVARQEGIML
ncbi:MAG: sugar phosphate isomerase/epimerase [Armatimonadota bacterium]|nr:sugar phosphate isomerase/epimerase [Armatimonadota bacterium]